MQISKSLSDRITAEAIAGHEQAIDCYTQAISDLIPRHRGDRTVDLIINQYVAILRVLINEWKEMRSR